ncbi:MAG: hypothetical protein R2753_15745 [Chitinophagales bacterium]
MKNSFENYLKQSGKSEKTIQNYLGAFTFINLIAEEIGLPNIEQWRLSNAEIFIDKIKKNTTFITQNNKGNNMYSASLNNYLKFMKDEYIMPQLPFESFGWRWATTGIASHLNTPKSLKIVLDAILINGNGNDNYTFEFKNLIKKLSVNKYGLSEQESDKLSKLSNPKLEKNIIENSANYWYHLELLETTGRFAKVSNLGEQFLNGSLSNDEFIFDRIDNYTLPNTAYKEEEIKKWNDFNIKIYPLKLIQSIFLELHEYYPKTEHHIHENDLARIVIPCSYDLEKFNVKYITEHIVEFRKKPANYSSWPNPQSIYTDDKGFRMANEFLYFLEAFEFLSSNKDKIRGDDKRYYATDKFIKTLTEDGNKIASVPLSPPYFKLTNFQDDCKNAGLVYSDKLITRFASSLATKPFVILTGLSGSGKTKLAQAFVQWICQEGSQYRIIPVGADWTNREPLLGYPNALKPEEYVKPDNGVIDLVLQANSNPDLPHFLILDEMNLSHVERYFADFLSVMESNEAIPLYAEGTVDNGVPSKLNLPDNLFIIGTVNIDETTNMFSPKVLDRANTIEFRINDNEMKAFLASTNMLDMSLLVGKGANMAKNFVELSRNKLFTNKDKKEINTTLLNFFGELQKSGAEFGYRSASEIHRLINQLDTLNSDLTTSEKLDIAIMQKLLPKLHGSRRKLSPILITLGSFCVEKAKYQNIEKDIFANENFELYKKEGGELVPADGVLYPLSLEKITRMYKGAIDNGFASYAEA